MKKLFYLMMLGLFAVACEQPAPENNEPTVSDSSLIVVSKTIGDHQAVVIKPSEFQRSAPVVVVLADDLELRTRMSPVSETPEVNFKAAEHCLIGGYTLCIIGVDSKDDLVFLRSIKNEFPYAAKLYLLSYRNGLAYTAAMQMPEIFAAFGCVSSAIDVESYKTNSFTKPVSFVHVHATENPEFKWTGVENKSASIPLSVGAVVAVDECTHYTTGKLLPRDGKGVVSYTKYLGGKEGHEVVLYSVEGANAGWCDEEFEVYNQIWNFYKVH